MSFRTTRIVKTLLSTMARLLVWRGRAAASVDKGCKCVLLREAREIDIRQSSRLIGGREP